MAWGTIRKATEDDHRAMDERANAFCKRHGIEVDEVMHSGPEAAIEWETDERITDPARARRLRHLWLAVVRRALHEPTADGIAYGYVGYHAD